MILITGASGQLASRMAKTAKAEGLPVQTASRSPQADRVMDFDQPDTLDFSGIETLLLLSAGYAEDDIVMQRHAAVLAAAKRHGVTHIVYTSLSAASDHLGFALAHRVTERLLMESGVAWTILRNGLYAELIGMLAAPHAGRITVPYGTAPISAVARDDLADAAVQVLREPGRHAGRIYELSGIAPFTIPQLAERLGVAYEPSSLTAERQRLSALPLLPFQPPMLLSIASAAMAGFLRSDGSDLLALIPQARDALTLACNAAQEAQEPAATRKP
ncbi:NAD(P)H-binding protein [Rhizobium sp. SSA_523]|uniref:NAD(P)H-binding protein n=1 Tax=Rhizobium sp. SSA_523 TaxID=2952477 RepID=UPI00209051F7|nr:NAD(P)H-binding protein [Rhizobium sp. SSA_523]MCO5730175.1 NAD(P)H-binding protein [Rhizobium sp. SSA_523]WKC25238.1 NAD(P)H-binding protein [Rhizobium sp. SSA_523]